MLRRLPPWLWITGGAALLGAAVWLAWPPGTPRPDPPGGTGLAPTPGAPWFVDVTRQAGIDFIHFDSATPQHYIQEVMGSGLAWIDYDADGRPDLFCVQDGPVRPEPAGRGPAHSPRAGPAPSCKLY